MDFHFAVSTPANTAKKDAVETKLKLTEGYIRQVWLLHPPGCISLAHATIFEGGHQMYPRNAEESYHGSGEPVTFPDNYYLEEPAILTLKTWNLDETYAHGVYVRITVLREVPDPLTIATMDLVKIIKRLIGIG